MIAIWYIKYCFISSSKLETWEFYLKAKLFGGIVSVRIPGGLPFLQEVCHFSLCKVIQIKVQNMCTMINIFCDFVDPSFTGFCQNKVNCFVNLSPALFGDQIASWYITKQDKTQVWGEQSDETWFRLIWLDSSKKVKGFFRKTIHLHHVNRWTKKAVKEAEMKRVLSHHLNLTPRIVDQE